MNWNKRDWGILGVLAVLALICLLPGLNSYGIIDPSDGLYTESAREMVEINSFITPFFNYAPFYEKPIFIYWAIIAGFKLFGVHEWVGRLPSALSAVLTVVVSYATLRFFWRRRTCLIASLVLLASPLFAIIGHLALTDMVLACFSSVTLLCLAMRLNGASAAVLWYGYVALALAVLVKGPIAILIAGATVALYLLVTIGGGSEGKKWYQMWWEQITRLHPLAGIVIVLALAAPWYIAECRESHGRFFEEFFVRQNLGRAMGSVNHQNPWWFYLPFLLGGFFPWCILLVAGQRQITWTWKHRMLPTKRLRLAVFSFCWAAVIIVLFGSLSTKLSTYILPVFPPLAMIVALSVDRCMLAHPRHARAMLSSVIGICLVVAVAVPVGLHFYDRVHDMAYRQLLFQAQADDANLANFWRDSPAASYYLRRRVPLIITDLDLSVFIVSEHSPHYLLVEKKESALRRIAERKEPHKIVGEKGKFCMFSFN